ncbi:MULTISPECIES: hypothetical protein [unclassified Yersinia (in: enterobacteria)]|uniref:hypothetical protein n=1 Tax=unclassified Yersinia (in: enterobacteria) TaxID=2653513 RepID=UPI003B285655
MWIEMKASDGKPTKEQAKWIDRMINAGFFAEVYQGSRNAKDSIESYLTYGYSDFPNANI